MSLKFRDTAFNTKWFCPDCWRHGLVEVPDPKLAQIDHNREVRDDMKAYKIPAGFNDKLRGSAIMDKYAGVACDGTVKIGARQNRPRFKKPELPMLLEIPEIDYHDWRT